MVKRWLTLSQVAERLQIDERIIIQWLRDHQLRGFKRDDVWMISARDLNAFLESRANVPSVGSAHDRKSISKTIFSRYGFDCPESGDAREFLASLSEEIEGWEAADLRLDELV